MLTLWRARQGISILKLFMQVKFFVFGNGASSELQDWSRVIFTETERQIKNFFQGKMFWRAGREKRWRARAGGICFRCPLEAGRLKHSTLKQHIKKWVLRKSLCKAHEIGWRLYCLPSGNQGEAALKQNCFAGCKKGALKSARLLMPGIAGLCLQPGQLLSEFLGKAGQVAHRARRLIHSFCCFRGNPVDILNRVVDLVRG